MTAVEWLVEKLNKRWYGLDEGETWNDLIQQALEMEKEQQKQIVLNLLNHELGHDDTARWIAERLEAGEINVNDL